MRTETDYVSIAREKYSYVDDYDESDEGRYIIDFEYRQPRLPGSPLTVFREDKGAWVQAWVWVADDE